jgi:hypothetical protein
MRLAQARMLLAMPAANVQAQEDAEAFMKRVGNVETNTCAHCRDRLRVVEQCAADASVLCERCWCGLRLLGIRPLAEARREQVGEAKSIRPSAATVLRWGCVRFTGLHAYRSVCQAALLLGLLPDEAHNGPAKHRTAGTDPQG